MPNYIDLSSKGNAEIEKAIKGSQKELLDAYKKAASDVNKEIASLYANYSEKGELSYAEVQKYNRLGKLEKSINGIVKGLKNTTQRITGKAMESAYKESYYLNMYLTEMQTKTGIGFTAVNQNMVNAAVMLPQSGLIYIQTITKNFAESLTKIKQIITNGIIRGDSYYTMSRRVRDVFGGNAYNAERVIRTEAHRTMVQGSIDAYDQAEELGVKSRRMWVATLDNRTRDMHAEMDGQYADEEGYFTLPDGVVTKGPGLSGYDHHDINDRCRVIAVVSGYEPTQRRQGGGEVIDFMTYSEWKEYRNVA
jgi:SPP1 gp7 family putative phage head morphogenesis protein